MTPRFKVGDQVLQLRLGRYIPVTIEAVRRSKRDEVYVYTIRYLDGGTSFWWDEAGFCTLEEATAQRLMEETTRR